MRLIKKLDLFILKSFLLLFAGTFFICLFIFLMQFLWRIVDDLVGKGLSWDVLGKFFYYSALMLVPMSLPLAMLLASLISFGNMGERFELLAMKAAGIPLVRILQPVFLFATVICGVSFYFQNRIAPEANRQMATLAYSMKQKSPELEIPEGIFYSEIPNYNLFVERKNRDTGMLYGVMIYSMADGYEDAQIVLADSAQLKSTEDKKYLQLTLYHGERFRNMDTQSGNMLKASVPYMRESFIREVNMIPFDANFNMMDASLFSGNAKTKDLNETVHSIDSLRHQSDSVGRKVAQNAMEIYLNKSLPKGMKDSLAIVKEVAQRSETIDSIYRRLDSDKQAEACKVALEKARIVQSEYEFRGLISGDTNFELRLHLMEANKKFSMSLACLLFFFVGAPLGAIIRKGGLGVPVVISVVFFIFYYIVSMGGEKMAKTETVTVTFGVWFSSALLFTIGMFLINRANKDSAVFNVEGYRHFLFVVFGLRPKRHIQRKEVIIYEPQYDQVIAQLDKLAEDCRRYTEQAHLRKVPNYWRLFFTYQEDHTVISLSKDLEGLVETLHNSRDRILLSMVNNFPILVPDAHTRPFRNARLNALTGCLIPVGLVFYFRVWRFRIRLWSDLQQVRKTCAQLKEQIQKSL